MKKNRLLEFTSILILGSFVAQPVWAGSKSDLEELVKAQQKQLAEQQKLLQQLQNDLQSLRVETKKAAAAPQTAPVQQASVGTPSASKTEKAIDYVRAGARPKSLRIPGTELDISIGGYAKADFIARLDGETNGAEDLFVVPGIVTNGTNGADDGVRLHARESRLNFDITGNTAFGKTRAFIEGDFFGAQGNEVISNSDSFRLRHAFGQVGGLLAGQTWTTFMDISAIANTLDFEGPGAETFLRQGQVRYTFDLNDIQKGLTFALAVENPESRAQLDGTGTVVSVTDEAPDFIARARYEQPWGHLQAAALVRKSEAPTGFDDETGFAITGSGKIKLPFLGAKDNFSFQGVYTNGASRYVLDAAIATGDIATGPGGQSDTIEVISGFAAFQHFWADNWRSTLVGSIVDIDRPSFFDAPNAIEETGYVAGNLIWSPVANIDIGAEVQYGRIQRENGERGDATRFQTSLIYRF